MFQHLGTWSHSFGKVRATNDTTNGFASKVPTATKPSGDGVILVGDTDVHNNLLLLPYGTGAADDTLSMRVFGWKELTGSGVTAVWIPILLAEFSCTLSTTTGISGGAILDTEFLADTIAITTGNDGTDTLVLSPTGNIPAHAMIDAKGFSLVEVTFTTGGSATDCNALYARL